MRKYTAFGHSTFSGAPKPMFFDEIKMAMPVTATSGALHCVAFIYLFIYFRTNCFIVFVFAVVVVVAVVVVIIISALILCSLLC
jgi:hypothetical protein